jgi:hypothetical protein
MKIVPREHGSRKNFLATNATIATPAGTKTNGTSKAVANTAPRGTTRVPTGKLVAILAPRAGTKMPWHRCPLKVVNTVAQVSIKTKMLKQVVKRIAMLGHT